MLNSFSPIIGQRARTLILGTMPGEESLSKGQYYAHPRNQFWRIMSSILNVPETLNYDQKIAILQEHGIALWDVLAHCERKGSLDSAIQKEIPNNIEILIREYPDINKICFNGGKAKLLFHKHGNVCIDGITYIKLSSTSPTPGKNVKSIQEKILEWKIAIKEDHEGH
jgi:hypoxanthine-DNA glycosylase